MATSNITIRMDKDLKDKADELFTDLGFNFTTAITAFVKQAVREQKIPFVISRDVTPIQPVFEASANAQEGA